MLYRYMAVFKVAAVGGSKALRGTAIALFVVAAIWLCVGIFPMELDDGPMPGFARAMLIIFGLGTAYGGFTVFQTAQKYEALSPAYKPYLMAIIRQDCYSLQRLADSLNVALPSATTKVEEMIDLEIFKGAYIDYQTNELVWGDRPVSQIVTVKCLHCGGNNDAIVGKNNKCQYCGSGLTV
jgi:hypothetical protein